MKEEGRGRKGAGLRNGLLPSYTDNSVYWYRTWLEIMLNSSHGSVLLGGKSSSQIDVNKIFENGRDLSYFLHTYFHSMEWGRLKVTLGREMPDK